MKFIKVATLIFATIFSLSAVARSSVPIVNYDNIPVTTASGHVLTEAQVKQAILNAATAKNWTIAYQADGKLEATLIVRAKHTIVVEVGYAIDKYSLNYKNSINMNFFVRDGTPLIHPFYNNWVKEFRDAIRVELLKS